MKDLCLVYQKENKSLIKKLVSKLESDGISCWIAPRDFKQEEKESLKAAIEDSRIVVLIIDKNSVSNKEMISGLNIGLENKSEIIPFVLEKIEPGLYSDNFFFTYSWVAAYENSFDEAYDILIEAYEAISGEKKNIKKVNLAKKNKSGQKNQKPIIFSIAAIALIIISYFVYNTFINDGGSSIIVGQWKLADYEDNLPRNHQDSLIFNQAMQSMKANASLTFNDDNTFERRGFTPEPQIGKWEFNAETSTLFLEPNGLNQRDQIRIENLNDTQFVMVVNEKVGTNQVTTKITFSRSQNM
jgi:hypothetical protein